MKIVAALVLTIAVVLPAFADVFLDHLEFEADQVALVWYVAPDDSGAPAAETIRPDGTFWGRDIRFRPWFLWWGGPESPAPVPGFPAEDLWLASGSGNLAQCPGGTSPDGPSDADGWFVWSSPLAAGGSTAPGEVVQLVINGEPVDEPLPLTMRSADINGDLVVNLTDVALFSESLFSGTDMWRADFDGDDRVDLTDITIFAVTWGAVCP